MGNANETHSFTSNQPYVKVSPAIDLDNLGPVSVKQLQRIRRETPKVLRDPMKWIDETRCMNSDTAGTENAMTFLNRLKRIAFNVFENLIRHDIVKYIVVKPKLKHIMLRIVGRNYLS